MPQFWDIQNPQDLIDSFKKIICIVQTFIFYEYEFSSNRMNNFCEKKNSDGSIRMYTFVKRSLWTTLTSNASLVSKV